MRGRSRRCAAAGRSHRRRESADHPRGRDRDARDDGYARSARRGAVAAERRTCRGAVARQSARRRRRRPAGAGRARAVARPQKRRYALADPGQDLDRGPIGPLHPVALELRSRGGSGARCWRGWRGCCRPCGSSRALRRSALGTAEHRDDDAGRQAAVARAASARGHAGDPDRRLPRLGRRRRSMSRC